MLDKNIDLTLLAQIESALHKRVEQGHTETRYTFEQPAAELTAQECSTRREASS